MNVTHPPSTDELHLIRTAEGPLVEVDGTTMVLFYFSIEELAELTPGEMHLLAALSVESDEQTQDMHSVEIANEYQDRIRERVTKTTFLPNLVALKPYEHTT